MAENTGILDINEKEHAIISWKDGHVSKYHVKWLRFHCRCEKCFRSFSGMYPLDTMKFPENFFIKWANVTDEELQFTTDHEIFENHFGRMPLDWLRMHCNCDQCFKKFISERENKFDNTKISSIEYQDVGGDNGLFKLLGQIVHSGFCLIHNVPTEESVISEIGDRIGPKFFTCFKEITLESDGNMNHEGICQDYPFYEVIPGVEIMYARRSSDKKYQTTLTDLLNAAEILRRESPDHFNSLTRIPATFQYKRDGSDQSAWFEIQKPHLEVDYFGKVVAVHWNPASEGKLRIHQKDVMSYCKAHNYFDQILKRKDNQIRLDLKPGDVLIFNNKRMAHRHHGHDGNTFQSLLHADDVKSKYIVLGHKLGKEAIPMKIGNRSSF